MTWSLQGLWVLLTGSAALAALTAPNQSLALPSLVLGLVVWAAGFAIEVVADRQKSQFRADPDNSQRFIDSGLWRWSRHPNYFGEILLWVGIAVIAWPTLEGWRYVTLISPVFTWLLLTRISGVRMLEARANRRWADDPDYQRYVRETPTLLMRRPRSAH